MSPSSSIRPLTADLQKTAIEQLNEVPQRIPDDIVALRTWIEQQPHLRARTDDQFLVAFLRGCKFSLEKAKSKIDRFYTLRTRCPELFRVTDVDSVLDLLQTGVMCYLPTPLHENGPIISVMRLGVYPADKYTFGDVIRMAQTQMEITLRENDYANINGVVVLLDLANVTSNHFFQYTPSVMKKTTTYSEEGIPLRPKATHFINMPSGFEVVYNMVKPMLSAKQQQRLIVHGNIESLHKHIPKKYLPKEYGGENSSLQDALNNWEQRILAYRDYFKDESNYGTDEKLRPGKPIDFDNIFGVEGSFRKIEVD